MLTITLSITAFIISAYAFLISVRSLWVSNRLNELNRFENGVHVIRNYADYNTMMRKFLVWDIEKFKKLK